VIIPFLFTLRRSLQETDEFKSRKHRPNTSEILRSLTANWRIVVIGTMMVTMTTVSFYMITAIRHVRQHRSASGQLDTLIVTLCVGASNLLWLPVMGALSDSIGDGPYFSFHNLDAGYRLSGDLWLGA